MSGKPKTLDEFWKLAKKLGKDRGGGHVVRLQEALLGGRLHHYENYKFPLTIKELHKPEFEKDLLRTRNIGRITVDFFYTVLSGCENGNMYEDRRQRREITELRRLAMMYPEEAKRIVMGEL